MTTNLWKLDHESNTPPEIEQSQAILIAVAPNVDKVGIKQGFLNIDALFCFISQKKEGFERVENLVRGSVNRPRKRLEYCFHITL